MASDAPGVTPAPGPTSWRFSIQRVLDTVRSGARIRDRLLIIAYYAILAASSVFRRADGLRGGVHPEFWLGDVLAFTPIGRFACRARTTDFDIVNPNYEEELERSLKIQLDAGTERAKVFLDIGAHIGKYSIFAGSLLRDRGTVLSFEPDPANFQALSANIRLNGLNNVRPLNMACWNEDGMRVLYRRPGNPLDYGGSSLVDVGAERSEVRVRALDSILPELGVSHVDVMKLDVQRAEAQVFRGARETLKANPRVVVYFEETGDPRSAESIQVLNDFGFEVSQLSEFVYVAVKSPKP